MEEKSTNLLLPPKTSSSSINCITVPVATPQTLSSCSATGNPRNKCALKPGHSLMDWIRLGNSGVDLSGTRGRIVAVSLEELAKHNTREDAWLAIRGVVYNVTRYMDFHPGGVEELMRGVGKDATKLFNEVHAWVNYQQLLNKCSIGPLKTSIKLPALIEETSKTETFSKPPRPPQQIQDIKPRLDWIQKRNEVTLYFYTKQFCNPGAVIRHNFTQSDKNIEIWILIDLYIYKYEFELEGSIKWPPKNMQISTESGKIEINYEKHEDQLELWKNLGKYEIKKVLATTVEEESLIDFTISYRKQFNDDSFMLKLKNENVLYILPVGYHLTLKGFINDKNISKSYTPIPLQYMKNVDNTEISYSSLQLHFLIKQYLHANSFSRYLCQTPEDSVIKVSIPMGNIKLSSLSRHRNICFLAAGSGLTPFLSLIDHLLKRNTNRLELLKLLYFNKTTQDIWCNEDLKNLASKDARFEFINILSNTSSSWNGLTGRVSGELISPIVSKSSSDKVTFIAACGPSGFNQNVEDILLKLNFPKENLFIF